MFNYGCAHLQRAYGHCEYLMCPNYIGDCPRHQLHGSTTALCNLERTKSLAGMGQETRDLFMKLVVMNPAMEESLLLLVNLAYADGQADMYEETDQP